MTITGEDAAAVTVTATADDYRAVQYQSASFRWFAALTAPLAAGAVASWMDRQTIGAVILGLIATGLFAYMYIAVNRQVRNLPSWAFRPYVFRFSDDGLSTDGPGGTALIRWGAITAVRKTPLAYWVVGHGGNRTLIFRRTLTGEQEQAIDAAIARYAARFGEPL